MIGRDPKRVALLLVMWSVSVAAQRGAQPGPPPTPKAAAPIDLTGYWVLLVTEDWRWRMVTPLKGDSASVPLKAAAKKILSLVGQQIAHPLRSRPFGIVVVSAAHDLAHTQVIRAEEVFELFINERSR